MLDRSDASGAAGPPDPAAVAVGAVEEWLSRHPGALDRVVFVLFDAAALKAYAGVHPLKGQHEIKEGDAE